jgi:hypothetical protein
MEGTCCELPPCHCSRAASIAAIAAFLDEMGQDSAAARVRRCVGQPAPDADATFLASILARAQAGGKATHDEIARLKRLAGWGDAPPCPAWDGSMDVHEVEKAVRHARERAAKGAGDE